MWSNVANMVKRYPLATFILLAYLFSWWPLLIYMLGDFPVEIAAFGPFLAALTVLAITNGRTAVMSLLKQMVRWRVGPQWYLIALGFPLLMTAIAVYLTIRLGAPAPSPDQLAAWPGVLPMFLIALLVPGLGGAWEEPG